LKNLIKGAILIMLISIAPALQANEIVNPVMNPRHTETPNAAEMQKLVDRLEEIKAMDISNMTNKEKRALRKEVKAAEKKVQNSGVYVSVGALIIIVLLLIILL
jgi:VIT1/CCC1 family predicted Fe2+/Mn2+ transporter